MIVVNGMPKSGTHAGMAWLSRMGLKRCPGLLLAKDGRIEATGKALDVGTLIAMPDSVFIHAHIPATIDLSGFSVVFILRDPRNVLVSYCRHRDRYDGLNVTVPEAIADFWGEPFAPLYRSYLGWRGRCNVVRYEDLHPETVGDGAELYEGHPDGDKWNTRTGAPSRWQDHWSPEADRAFVESGGLDLLDRAGYI